MLNLIHGLAGYRVLAIVFCVCVATKPLPADDMFPIAKSKKGLQVQMVDDALELGVQHAALNVNLGQLIDPHATKSGPKQIEWQYQGRPFFFRRSAVEHLDRQIKPLSEAGVLVYLILLVYKHHDQDVNQILMHPNYDSAAPNHLSAFNTRTPDGRRWLSAAISFLAHRWSPSTPGQAGSHGQVVGYVVGNEVNSHWFWSNQGEVTLEEFTTDYHDAVRLVHNAVRSAAKWPRVYISLEHHWSIRYPGGNEKQAFPGRTFLDRFAALSKQHGDFDWHVAFHPYPEDLFDPRFWEDESAINSPDTPRITFRNINVLTQYLQQQSMQFQGKTRRVIFSEQGFHTPDGDDGEDIQAAAYCLAWHLVNRNTGVDAFILHRHVDHKHEGGLRLGLWLRKPDSVATPDRQKRIYDCFRDADTDRWESTFRFALPIVGKPNWQE